MKILRILFVLLLCAVLPLSGLAASGVTGPCPMQTGMDAASHASAADMTACESMMSTSGGHGKSKGFLCKMTAQCQIGSLYYPVSAPTLVRPAGRFFSVTFHYEESFSIRAPDGLWRPPRTV